MKKMFNATAIAVNITAETQLFAVRKPATISDASRLFLTL
jgi:hypothetical protein